ncbi:hypothetical protein B0H12DRAFT_273122 [Mycena haematopus]|nr:hypothetical protein B0H12DRAFT_273122 [Mycena haematopus]
MLLELPVEILHEIGCQIPGTAEKKNLRSVCKDLALAMDSLIFGTIILNTDTLHLADGRSIIEALVTDTLLTDWSHFPTALKIDHIKNRPQGYQPPNDRLEERLHLALSSMPNIRTVIWKIRSGYPDWPRRAIIHFLESHQLIDEIEIHLETRVDMGCSWEHISGLRKLKIHSLYTPPTIFAQLSRLVATNHGLKALHLLAPTVWSQFWVTLRVQQIHLTDVATNNVTDDFLGYLGSYSGLQRLTLQYPDAHMDTESSDQLADHFFGSVLPQHATSLLHLSCAVWFEGRWCFGTHNANVICGLRRLSRLEMSVNAHDVPHENSESYSGTNAPERLLQIATELPVRYLGIFPADPEASRGTLSGAQKQNYYVSNGIIATLRDFTACSSSPSIVVAGFMRKWYQLNATTDPNTPFEYSQIPR